MPRSSATWAKGIPSPNPGGKIRLDRVAEKQITEAWRKLIPVEDLGNALLAIFAGVDPFAKVDPKNPDGVPTMGPIPIDWAHRMAAVKLFLEYSRGKPLQGIAIQAQIEQTSRVVEERSTVTDMAELAKRSPAAREALRTLAREALTQPARPVLDVPSEPVKTEE